MHESGLTQLDLSAQIGIAQSQISNWLKGEALPGYLSLKLLAMFFKISADELLGLNR